MPLKYAHWIVLAMYHPKAPPRLSERIDSCSDAQRAVFGCTEGRVRMHRGPCSDAQIDCPSVCCKWYSSVRYPLSLQRHRGTLSRQHQPARVTRSHSFPRPMSAQLPSRHSASRAFVTCTTDWAMWISNLCTARTRESPTHSSAFTNA